MYTEDTSLLTTNTKAFYDFIKKIYKDKFVPKSLDDFMKHLTRRTESGELCYFDDPKKLSAMAFFYKYGVTIPDSCVENLQWSGPLAKDMVNLEYWKMLVENIMPYDYEELQDLKVTMGVVSDNVILKSAQYLASEENDDAKKSIMRQSMASYLGGYNRLECLLECKYNQYADEDASNYN